MLEYSLLLAVHPRNRLDPLFLISFGNDKAQKDKIGSDKNHRYKNDINIVHRKKKLLILHATDKKGIIH